MSERSSQSRLATAAVAAVARELGPGASVGLAARHLVTGQEILLDADALYPLASVFKVPLMVTVMRRVDANLLALDERIILREGDKSPGQGGILCYCHAGLQPTVRDLLYFTITQSDNTAADMLWRHVGLESIDETMRELGLDSIACSMPNREFFLIEAGLGSDWAGRDGPAIVARWREIDTGVEARRAAFARLLAEHAHLTGAEFTRLYDQRWGLSGELGGGDARAIDQALDNLGSPRDTAELLAMIAEDRCASPPSCRLMMEILTRQEWRQRIPAGLPAGLRVGNKTGSVAGSVNDAAVVGLPNGGAYVLAVFCKGLDDEQTRRADGTVAALARCVHEQFAGAP